LTDPSTVLPKTDPPLQETEVFGHRLTFTDEGPKDAPTLIAVHGVPGSVRDFRYLAPPLAPFSRFIRVDLPGSGGSAPRREALRSLKARAETVLRLADQLKVEGFGMIGHSMGAGTALVTGSAEPSRVARLVMIAPLGLRPHRALSRSRASFGRISRLLRTPVLRHLVLPQVRRNYKKRRFPRAEEMTASEYAIQFESFTAADFTVMRRSVEGPLPTRTLVVFADDDHLVEPEIPVELAAAIPGARTLRFSEGGHTIQKTKAPEIAAAILEL